MIVVVDASVALKWFLNSPNEQDGGMATGLLEAIGGDRMEMLQPPHFLAEVLAVLARETPDTVLRDLEDLQRVKWGVAETPTIYAMAASLAFRLQHHVFDTLYHATALATPGATFVTADHAYFRKARHEGRIERLADFVLAGAPRRPPIKAD